MKRIPDGTLQTLRTRKRLLEEVGQSYFSKDKFGRPTESIFVKMESEGSVEMVNNPSEDIMLLDDESSMMAVDSVTR